MPDPLTPAQRHACMSHVRSKNTKPEVALRKALFAQGYRYRINRKDLPGSPDIVLAKYRTCIFVNGCFWHGHSGCSKFVLPKTNTEFWSTKIANNRERDLRDYAFLESRDWRVVVVWECEITKDKLPATVERIKSQLDNNRTSWLHEVDDRKARREEWRAEIKYRKIAQQLLLEETLKKLEG